VVRLCYEFKCVVSFGGGSLPLQVCDDCDSAGYSAGTRSVKLRSLTFKGLTKSEGDHHHHHHHHGHKNHSGDEDDEGGESARGGEGDDDEDEDSYGDMTSSESELEDGAGLEEGSYALDQDGNAIHSDDYGSNDSFSTAGESGTYVTSSSYSSFYSPNPQQQQSPFNIHNNNVQNKIPNNNGAGTGGGGSGGSLVGGWVAIVHAKLVATKMARRMKRKLAVEMAKRANDHDLAKALPEAVDGCVSPHMNMIALLSYGGGGKGGSGYHLQVRTYLYLSVSRSLCVYPSVSFYVHLINKNVFCSSQYKHF
jgi:hypothetical protein